MFYVLRYELKCRGNKNNCIYGISFTFISKFYAEILATKITIFIMCLCDNSVNNLFLI